MILKFLPLVAAGLSFLITSVAVNRVAEPRVKIIATYARTMPWDALVIREKSPYVTILSEMVANWARMSQQDLGSLLPNDYFEARNIKIAQWSDWDGVKEAKDSLAAFNDLLFIGYTNLLEQVKTRNSSEQVKHDDLVVAMTPERGGQSLTNRVSAFREAVEKSLPSQKGRVRILQCSTYDEVILGLANGSIDFATCSPYSTYIAHEGMGNNVRLAGQIQKSPLDGYKVVLIKSTDQYTIPDDIDRFQFIYASESSTSGYLIPLRMLNGLGVNLRTLNIERKHSYENHDAVIDKVQSLPGYLAGVPSDKLEPLFASVRYAARLGAAIGVAIGAAVCYLWLILRKRRHTDTRPLMPI